MREIGIRGTSIEHTCHHNAGESYGTRNISIYFIKIVENCAVPRRLKGNTYMLSSARNPTMLASGLANSEDR
jgi:hypothetical protein